MFLPIIRSITIFVIYKKIKIMIQKIIVFIFYLSFLFEEPFVQLLIN